MPFQTRNNAISETLKIVSRSLLGLTIGCAQCHDHKFDPILQKDHFALQAFLNTSWWPENYQAGTTEQKQQLLRWEQETTEIRKQLNELKAAKHASAVREVVKQFPEDIQAIYRKPTAERSAYEEQLAQLVQRQVDAKQAKIDWEKTLKKDAEKWTRFQALNEELKAQQ